MNNNLIMKRYFFAILAASLCLFSGPSFAHHMMDGGLPQSNLQGLISGIAHPVIDIEHLAFIVAISLLAMMIPKRGYLIPLTFIIATIAGAVLQYTNALIVYNDVAVAVSIIAAGLLLFSRFRMSTLSLLLFAGISGISHGSAYGEAIIGAETTYLMSYLVGFCLIQLSVSLALYFSFSALHEKKPAYTRNIIRFFSIVISLSGVTFIMAST